MEVRLHIVLIAAMSITTANGAIATFDDMEEGHYGEQLVCNGITFFDADAHYPSPVAAHFSIDDATETVPLVPGWEPYFSPPNFLTMSGYSPGPGLGTGRFGEFKATTGQIESYARIDVFHSDGPDELGNYIVFEAYLDGELVASDLAYLSADPYESPHDRLVISGVDFDTVRLAGEGPSQDGYFMGAVDNLLIIPEPGTLVLLLAAGLIQGRRIRCI